jgi:hypothetical protein
MVIAYFKLPPQHLPGGTEESHQMLIHESWSTTGLHTGFLLNGVGHATAVPISKCAYAACSFHLWKLILGNTH